MTLARPRVLSRLTLRSPLTWAAAGVLVILIAGAWLWMSDSARTKAPVVLWECEACGREFRAAIPLRVPDQSVTDCPQCKKHTARRKLNMRCLDCGKEFVYRPARDAARAAPAWNCPACKSFNTRPQKHE